MNFWGVNYVNGSLGENLGAKEKKYDLSKAV
jgi:hypothetical protein